MKKLLVLFTVALIALSGCSTGSSGSDKTLTVAAPSKISGDFVEGFSNGSYDAWVMRLIGNTSLTGASTHYVDPDTELYVVNETNIEKVEQSEDNGNKTFTYTLKDGLKWSDGEAITAKDFVFSVLFRANPEWLTVAQAEERYYDLLGYKAYSAGETDVFEGVKYIDDKTFSVTVDGAKLPYYYENYLSVISADPAHAFMSDFALNDNGNGFNNTPEEIKKAVDHVNTNERVKPTVVSGPYKFDSFQDGNAIVKANENYNGSYDGTKPTIGTVVIKEVKSDLQIQSIVNGEVDLAPGVVEAANIQKAEEEGLGQISYPRSGYGKITIKANQTPTNDQNVRQALGFLLNRDEFVTAIAEGYGTTVNGPYGLSQWFYKDNKEALESELIDYTFNLDKANELLDASPYVYEEDGTTPFDKTKATPDSGYYRYNAEKVQLHVKHFGTDDNVVTDLIGTQLIPAAQSVGLNFTLDRGEFATLLDYLQDRVDHDYNTFNLATSFTPVYDPYYSFYTGQVQDYTSINNAELDALIIKLRTTEPGDTEAFSKTFLEYVKLWNELLPEIPLYSNQYFDIFATKVKGLDKVTPNLDWSMNINYITID